MPGLRALYNASKYNTLRDPTQSFSGKTILVTGSNTGLGLAAAKKYAALGAKKIIIAVRNLEKGEQAKAEVLAHAQGKIVVEVWQIDMSQFSSVKAFADRIDHDLHDQPLHIASLNAGVTFFGYHESPDGWNEMLQVNTLSTVLLAILLLPKLRASKSSDWIPVLTFTSSGTSKGVPASTFELPKDAPKTKTPFLSYCSQPNAPAGQEMYSITKLLLEFSIQNIAHRPIAQDPKTNKVQVIVNSSCPGFVATDLARDFVATSSFFRAAVALLYTFWSRTAEQGSRTLVSATTLGEESQGQFWQNDTIVTDRGLVTSPDGKAIQARMWDEIMSVLTEVAPQVNEILG